MVRFLTFEQLHNKKNIGSTRIRVHNLIKHWPEAELYKYGEKPDVLVFQKVYWVQDYPFIEDYPGIKILDICDPDWIDNAYVKRTVDAIDAVVVPTKAMQEFIQQMTNKPVRVIKDRFDLSRVPKPKVHKDKKGLSAAWFGYHHNAEVLRSGAVRALEKHDIGLNVIAEDDPLAWRWATSDDYKEKYKYIKYNEDSIYKHLQENDFCILPFDNRPRGRFKSENKTTKAQLAGLPVVHDVDELEKYMSYIARQKDSEYNYSKAIKEYDCKQSVKEYQQLIEELKAKRKGV